MVKEAAARGIAVQCSAGDVKEAFRKPGSKMPKPKVKHNPTRLAGASLACMIYPGMATAVKWSLTSSFRMLVGCTPRSRAMG